MAARDAWGPDGRRAAVSVTFDNLGEAAEIEQGLWPADRAVGEHPSVTEALPWILGLLDDLGLRATFFVEGINAEIYPQAVAGIASRGHEVAYHAWRHESWGALEGAEEEERILRRGPEAMERLGIRPRGFRPPGGKLNARSLELLRESGFDHCSPEGDEAIVEGGVAILPFAWPLVDAYYFYEPFGSLREAHGDSKDPLPPAKLREKTLSALNEVARNGGYLCLLFHPFLLLEEDRRGVLREVLEEIVRRDRATEIWYAPCGDVADHVLSVAGSVRQDGPPEGRSA